MDRLYQSENFASITLWKKYVTIIYLRNRMNEDGITLSDGTLRISYHEECIDQFDYKVP